MKPFEQDYWNLTTTLIWIYLRDKNFILQEWDFIRKDKISILGEAQEIKAERDGYDEIKDKNGNVLELAYPDPECAQQELLEKLKNSKNNFVALGTKSQNSASQEIPACDWHAIELKIYDRHILPAAAPNNSPNEKDWWKNILFPRIIIMRFWPENPIQKTKQKPSDSEIKNALDEIIKKCKNNSQFINREFLYEEMNVLLPNGKITMDWAKEEIKNIPQDIKRKRGQRGKSFQNNSDKK
jgi:hypothetical protein